ncbi:hypothetical protein Cabys_2366 [Caldithrix abyssi DSM 13497]|uniref:Uncharacterized protein n=1 Tax=Caldithrix abyssi DSM 13497 TaxID=880073 RepID=A0A1J1C8S7_CALAY|nr:hypothetical protein Cabys_2366 [Caldithrix abyssi DSM 13497]
MENKEKDQNDSNNLLPGKKTLSHVHKEIRNLQKRRYSRPILK